MRLFDKKMLVVGAGVSGLAAARLGLSRGAKVEITDKAREIPAALALAKAGASLALGGHQLADFTGPDLIVVSPGVDLRIPELAAAKAAGVEIIGELELAWRSVALPVIAITGTNGKSTVTTLVGRMLEAAGKKVFLGGNLGRPFCELPLAEEAFDWAVVEVSSFQADSAPTFQPQVGVLLNISPDHLDRYDSPEDYAASKLSFFKRQQGDQVAVLCADDPPVAERAGEAGGRVWLYGATGPKRPGGWLKYDEAMLDDGRRPPLLLGLAKSRLPGGFNRLNLLAASLAAHAAGVPGLAIQKVINEFPGLAHRLAFVAEKNGVAWYDDSKGTNVGAVAVALAAMERPTVLLLGGRDKEGPFANLEPQLGPGVIRVICFGEAGPSIHRQIKALAAGEIVADLAQAVRRAAAVAAPGQAVLLSPGCASFDAYNSYAQRGDHFAALVGELPNG